VPSGLLGSLAEQQDLQQSTDKVQLSVQEMLQGPAVPGQFEGASDYRGSVATAEESIDTEWYGHVDVEYLRYVYKKVQEVTNLCFVSSSERRRQE